MIKVIGCGNILRGDDGVGLWVIEELKKHSFPEGIEIIEGGITPLDLLSQIKGAKKVILIDAVTTQNKPGTIYRLPIEKSFETSYPLTLHDIKWQEVLLLGREVLGDKFPEEIIFFGMEIETVEFRVGLSPRVKKSLSKLLALIQQELTKECWTHR